MEFSRAKFQLLAQTPVDGLPRLKENLIHPVELGRRSFDSLISHSTFAPFVTCVAACRSLSLLASTSEMPSR